MWNAADFFEALTKNNRFAVEHKFHFARVSSLDGFHDALAAMTSAPAFVAVSDTSEGVMSIENTPHTRRIKSVFMAVRHPVDRLDARAAAFDVMRELFRQFMSVLLLEKTRLEQSCIFIDPAIQFSEVDRYFFSGCACAFFQIAVDTYADISYNSSEWLFPITDQ